MANCTASHTSLEGVSRPEHGNKALKQLSSNHLPVVTLPHGVAICMFMVLSCEVISPKHCLPTQSTGSLKLSSACSFRLDGILGSKVFINNSQTSLLSPRDGVTLHYSL